MAYVRCTLVVTHSWDYNLDRPMPLSDMDRITLVVSSKQRDANGQVDLRIKDRLWPSEQKRYAFYSTLGYYLNDIRYVFLNKHQLRLFNPAKARRSCRKRTTTIPSS